MIAAEPLEKIQQIRHGFFTREGGVSDGLYKGRNCGYGSGDDRDAVRENRARVAADLGAEPDALLTVHQIHSASAVTVEEKWAPADAPEADAMVTGRSGIALGVLAADCAPVLFADPERNIVGAAHAGWKGALAGVLDATLDAMERLGADRRRVTAAIGPCISQPAYEVGSEFRDRFLAATSANAQWFAAGARADHFLFDLAGYVEARLQTAGVGTAVRAAPCTYADENRFFSFRRTTHRGEPDYGRQVSAIMLTAG